MFVFELVSVWTPVASIIVLAFSSLQKFPPRAPNAQRSQRFVLSHCCLGLARVKRVDTTLRRSTNSLVPFVPTRNYVELPFCIMIFNPNENVFGPPSLNDAVCALINVKLPLSLL